MRKITRYVLFELIVVFMITLTCVTVLMILAGLIKEGIREGLGFASIIRLIPYVVPVALQPSLPATVLIAVCSVYGRMSADNEITAIKSLGVSPLAVISPGLALGFLVSLFGVWINDIAPSWGRIGIYRVAIESAEEIIYRMLRTQHSYSNQFFSINVKNVDGRQLIHPYITIKGKGDSPEITINARTAELTSDLENDVFNIILRDGMIDVENRVVYNFRNSVHEQAIPLPSVMRKGKNTDSPSVIPLRNMESAANEQRKRIEAYQRLAATRSAYQLMVGDFAGLGNTHEWTPRMQVMERDRSRLHKIKLEPYRRWATGFSCFFFVLVGAPLAIKMKTSNFFTTFAACFFPILLAYYPLLAIGISRVKDGALPPITVWLGNLVMLIVGAWILRRVIRY